MLKLWSQNFNPWDVLDSATEELHKQEKTQSNSHHKIISDLTNIQQKSQDALKKLGKCTILHHSNGTEKLLKVALTNPSSVYIDISGTWIGVSE